jgi:hypothetical protein
MLTTLSKSLLFLSFFALLASATGCRNGPLPCPDCDDQADDDSLPDLPPPDDLPCGGADFMNDSYNCGSCGSECTLWYEGTDWEAGTCIDGVCGPQWKTCIGEGSQANTCDEICGSTGLTCVANGCSGMTAMLFDVFSFGSCGPDPDLGGPDGTMTGPCNEQIPWLTTIETSRQVMCCCGE